MTRHDADHDAGERAEQPPAPLPQGRWGLRFRIPPEQRLGEILLELGLVSKRRLQQALVSQGLSHKPLGEILVDMKIVEPHALEQAFRIQEERKP